jgi:hypothetical protein
LLLSIVSAHAPSQCRHRNRIDAEVAAPIHGFLWK